MTDLFAQLAALDCAATVVVDSEPLRYSTRQMLAERLGKERASSVTVIIVRDSDVRPLMGRAGPVFVHPDIRPSLAVADACYQVNQRWQRPPRLERSTRMVK